MASRERRLITNLHRERLTGGWLLLLTFSAVAPAGAAQADDRDARIAALQARVEALESQVRMLVDRQAMVGAPDEDRLREAPALFLTPPPDVPGGSQPPVAVSTSQPSPLPQELLPNLGKIGAAASFLAGAHSGPFDLRAGPFIGGAVELPLFLAPGGRVLYEFSASFGRSDTDLRVTSDVAQVANLAVLANIAPSGGQANVDAALAGRAPAPFAVQYDVESELQLLQVVPFGLKYVSTAFDRFRVRPYAAAGLATFVTITNQRTSGAASGSAFEGALIGGQIAAAQELAERGVPSGQGGIKVGFTAGGGFEWRARGGVSFGLDLRYNRVGNGRSFATAATRTGFHF